MGNILMELPDYYYDYAYFETVNVNDVVFSEELAEKVFDNCKDGINFDLLNEDYAEWIDE